MTDTTTSAVERLAAKLAEWSETPYEGDPMIDALLSGVPEAAAILRALVAERDRLREALADIAHQKKSTEFGDTQGYMDADFEGGYDECVTRARAALEANNA